MILKANLGKIVEIINGVLLNNVYLDQENFNISTDTRQIKKSEIFIALKGENFNGNYFIKKASDLGASIIIIDEIVENNKDINLNFIQNECKSAVILVNNCSEAYGSIANYYRNHQLNESKVVGITGSIGKTTTKNLCGFVMKKLFNPSYMSEANLNNQVGVPKNILKSPDDARSIIVEMGMQKAGEINFLSKVAEPDIAIITNVSPSHLEFFKNVEEIALAKSEIFNYMKSDGWAILNKNNAYFNILYDRALEKAKNILTYSSDKNIEADIILQDYIINDDNSARLVVSIKDFGDVEYSLPIAARSIIENSLVIFCLGYILELNFFEIADAIQYFPVDDMKGRGRIIFKKFTDNREIIIIDEVYNAGFEAMKAALDNLIKLPFKKNNIQRRIAILGEMREIGENSRKLHGELVSYANKADFVITVGGDDILYLNSLLDDNKNLGHFKNSEDLIEKIDNLIKNGDLILIKGANGVRLDKIIEYLESK